MAILRKVDYFYRQKSSMSVVELIIDESYWDAHCDVCLLLGSERERMPTR